MDRQPAVIFDRDGTLFSVAHHMGEDGPNSWESYNGLVAFDAPVPRIAALWHAIRPGVTRIVTSGRMEHTRRDMAFAFHKHGIFPDLLLMRRNKDTRRDSIVKTEIYRAEIEPYFDVRYVIDDRPQVVDAWRELGLPVLAVRDPGVLPAILG
jgi:FMN phosphatase YigB (HAD superfamily)